MIIFQVKMIACEYKKNNLEEINLNIFIPYIPILIKQSWNYNDFNQFKTLFGLFIFFTFIFTKRNHPLVQCFNFSGYVSDIGIELIQKYR